jgi:hypothetical protein
MDLRTMVMDLAGKGAMLWLPGSRELGILNF